MLERKRINILYYSSGGWAGGVYYVSNIIKALNQLDDDLKPVVYIFHLKNSFLKEINSIQYPYMEYVEFKDPNLLKKIINKTVRLLFNKYGVTPVFLTKNNLDNLFWATGAVDFSKIKQPVFWIPDFQEEYYPQLFSKKTIWKRRYIHKAIARTGYDIVFSSNTAKSDFDKFYPKNTNKKHVLQFLSIVDLSEINKIRKNSLLEKYSIKEPYFIVCNQFWVHKNHITVLKALKIIKDNDVKIHVVFTGKEFDARNPGHFDNLKLFIKENNLEEYVSLLGFIDRVDQLALIKHSVAVLQPSLFEGWNTIVEESKAIGKNIILSDIPVHREQIYENVRFFDPENETELACLLMNFEPLEVINNETMHGMRIQQFAKKFLSVFH